jgi:hypothetical protein
VQTRRYGNGKAVSGQQCVLVRLKMILAFNPAGLPHECRSFPEAQIQSSSVKDATPDRIDAEQSPSVQPDGAQVRILFLTEI